MKPIKLVPGKMLLFSAMVVLLMCSISIWAWPQIPDDTRIPTHWNANGKANGYSSKNTGLFMLPEMVAGLSILLTLFPAITPRREHLLRSMRAYKILWGAILLFFLSLHIVIVLAALGKPVPMPKVILSGMGILFMVIGNWMGKVRSNFIMGVRTPWTLSSELSWNKTHRLAGKLFVIAGLIIILTGLLTPNHPAADAIVTVCILAVAIVPVIYSWFVWKNDPKRQS